MPALPRLSRPKAFTNHLPTILPRAATAVKLLLTSRQNQNDDDDERPYTVIPSEYGSLHSSPSPGVVAGIVLGSVAGFLLILALIYTCLNGLPLGIGATASDGVSTYVSRADDRSRRRSAAARRRTSRSTSRHSTGMYEVRTRTTTTRERVVPVPVDTPTASAFEPRRAPSSHRGSRPPPPRVVPRDRDESSGSDEDEVVVIEEHSPPRRKGRRPSPSYLSDDRSRRDSSYRDAESDLYSRSRR